MKRADAGASTLSEAPEDPEPAALEKPAKPGNRRRPPMTLEQQALAIHYLPLARRLAKPFKAACSPYWDDFESAACLGLVHAAQTYDSSKRVKFPTYARKRILGELRDVWRDMQLSGWRDSDKPPMVQHLGFALERNGRVLCASAQMPVEKDLEARDTADHWLTKLPKPHAKACRMIVIEEMTHRQAGTALGLSKSRIQKLHKESLALLDESVRWKNVSAHEDDQVKPPLSARKKADVEAKEPELRDVASADLSRPDIVEP